MISSSQRPLPDNLQHLQQTNIHAPGGIRTHNLSKRAALDRAATGTGTITMTSTTNHTSAAAATTTIIIATTTTTTTTDGCGGL